MLNQSPKADINYLAKIVVLPAPRTIPKADNLKAVTIDGNNVLVSKDAKAGDLGIFFPLECQIDFKFLHVNNLFSHSELNIDSTQKGYFTDSGRVKAVKLRGENSEGFWIPISSLDNLTDHLKLERIVPVVNTEFDTIHSIQLVRKYRISKTKREVHIPKPKTLYGKFRFYLHQLIVFLMFWKRLPVHKTHLVPGQFREHYDTEILGKCAHIFGQDDQIVITEKLHGTSFIASDLLFSRKPNYLERIASSLGAKIQTQDYEKFFATRRTIRYPDTEVSPNCWYLAYQAVEPFLTPGLSVFGEVVGYQPSGKWIQKNYDYGCKPGEQDIYIYRMTWTSPDGKVFEFPWEKVEDWCQTRGLKTVPVLYKGAAYKWMSQQFVTSETGYEYEIDVFLPHLKKEFLEKRCTISKNKVWSEGVVIRRENANPKAYKLKSFNFWKHESESLDAGEISLEDQEVSEISEDSADLVDNP